MHLGPELGLELVLAADRRQELYRAWWLWLSLLLLVLLLACVMWALSRRRRMLDQTRGKAKIKPIKDAWQEAGRRAEPLPDADLNPEEDEP